MNFVTWKIVQENRKLIISKRLSKIKFDQDVNDKFLMDLCQQMDSYVMQDLIDYCDKVLFEVFKGNTLYINSLISFVRYNSDHCFSLL